MIEAVILDFGRVISAQKPASLFRRYERDLGIQPGSINRTMFDSDDWQQVLVGQMTSEEYWARLGPRLNLMTPERIEAFRQRYQGDEAINEGVLELIRHLYGEYRLAVLSNCPAGLSEWLKRWQILHFFDQVLCSGDEGLAKPDPAFFLLALTRLGVLPQEAVFVDDSAGHVQAARALGLHALRFDTASTLAEDLGRLLVTQGKGPPRWRTGISLDIAE